MEIQTLDTAGINLIAGFEGCVLHPYLDQVGIPTIGIGMTYYPSTGAKVKMTDQEITQQQANDMFAQMVKPFELAVYSVTRHDLTQNQFNALVSFAYNIGIGGFKGSTVLKMVNNNVLGKPLADAFMMWNKAGGKVIGALSNRRAKEFDTYMS